jgi:pilus assembly protein Flp/PilA
MRKFIAFLADERGATAIEYGLMAAMIAVGCIAAFTVLGGDLQSLFGASETGVGGKFEEAMGKL